MAEKVAGSAKTRVQLTIETADNDLKMFWTRPSSGCGSFRRKIGLDGAEFKELGPIGKLTGGHRQRMIGQLKDQSARVGGGTGGSANCPNEHMPAGSTGHSLGAAGRAHA
jgi:hypothetical protein